MYIRFVINIHDEDSNKRQGLFQAIAALRDQGKLYDYERILLKELHNWFNEHLEKPNSFSTSKRPHAKNIAISWYKDTAIDHISKMYELVSMLEAHNCLVDVVKTDKPGYIVYEDEFQVIAEPFIETET